MDIYDLWGKTEPYKPLLEHMIDAGNVAKALLQISSLLKVQSYLIEKTHLNTNQITGLITYLAAMHDIGKAHPCFEQEWRSMMDRLKEIKMDQPVMSAGTQKFRHELYSEEVMRKRMLEKHGFSSKTIRQLSKIEALHHQGKQGVNKEITFAKPEWEHLQDDLEQKIFEIFPCEPLDLCECAHVDGVCMMIWALVILSDWLSSGEMSSAPPIHAAEDVMRYANWSAKEATNIIARCGLEQKEGLPAVNTYEELWPYMTQESLRPVQAACQRVFDNHCPQLLVIEAPMGEGKTEAAVYAAAKMGKGSRGIYFALPSTATGTQMHKRMQELYARITDNRVRLLHGSAWLVDESTQEWSMDSQDDAVQWLAPMRRGLLEMSAVGTVDQAMLSVMTAKYSVLRLLGLSGKVLIIDEVHAYDAYMSGIIERLLSWCAALDVPVILLSATLPLKKKSELVRAYLGHDPMLTQTAYPLITCVGDGRVEELHVQGTYINRCVKLDIRPILHHPQEIADLALKSAEAGGCICVLLNTVKEAQKLYEILKKLVTEDVWLRLLHARFTASERKRIENECDDAFSKNGKRPKRAILIATQVCEQSCDYDFDEMISAIAPIDLLFQRMGRMHRHERIRPQTKQNPRLTVLVPDGDSFGSTELVYDKWILTKTLECLKKVSALRIPQDIRPLVETVYEADGQGHEAYLAHLFTEELESAQGKFAALKEPNPKRFGMLEDYSAELEDEQIAGHLAAKTRLGEESVKVAFLDREIFGLYDFTKPVSKCTARLVMKNAASLAKRMVCKNPAKGYVKPAEGCGLLKGVVIYPTEDGRYDVDDNKIAGYKLDKEMGILVERRV